MILADKFTCEIPEDGAVSIECAMPATDVLEWMTGLGTAGAALAAVGFGIVEIVRSRKERARLKSENQRQLLNSQFQKVAGIMAEIAEVFPLNTDSQSNRFHAQVRIYEDLLDSSSDVPVVLKQKTGSLFTHFGTIALQNNVDNCRTTRALHHANKIAGANGQILPGSILRMLSMRLETALSAWHASGVGADSAIEEIEQLDNEMSEHQMRINEYRREWEIEAQ